MAGKKFNLSGLSSVIDEDSEERQAIKVEREESKKKAESLPSVYSADLRVKLRDRVPIALRIPRFIKEQMSADMVEMGLKSNEYTKYIYQLLREKGLDIPADDQLDLRKS